MSSISTGRRTLKSCNKSGMICKSTSGASRTLCELQHRTMTLSGTSEHSTLSITSIRSNKKRVMMNNYRKERRRFTPDHHRNNPPKVKGMSNPLGKAVIDLEQVILVGVTSQQWQSKQSRGTTALTTETCLILRSQKATNLKYRLKDECKLLLKCRWYRNRPYTHHTCTSTQTKSSLDTIDLHMPGHQNQFPNRSSPSYGKLACRCSLVKQRLSCNVI